MNYIKQCSDVGQEEMTSILVWIILWIVVFSLLIRSYHWYLHVRRFIRCLFRFTLEYLYLIYMNYIIWSYLVQSYVFNIVFIYLFKKKNFDLLISVIFTRILYILVYHFCFLIHKEHKIHKIYYLVMKNLFIAQKYIK